MKRIAIALLVLLLIALAADARVGGGQSYSGSSSSSSSSSSSYSGGSYSSGGGGSSSGGGGCSTLFIVMIVMLFLIVQAAHKTGHLTQTVMAVQAASAEPAKADMTALRRFDPNFSEIVFTDFCYSLYARVYEALGRGEIDLYAPYVAPGVRDGLKRHAAGLTSIDEIVIGSFNVAAFRGIDQPTVEADVEFEANYTETRNGAQRRFYVRELWTLTRARDVLSPAPENAKAEHCPKCGAPLQTRTDGACLHCGTIVRDGSFNWFVRTIRGITKDERPRDLGGSGPEVGTESATRFQHHFAAKKAAFDQNHPGFDWPDFEQRVRLVANELQTAWSTRDWQRARPYETGALFQMHRYWIDEYTRQRLRNIVDHFTIHRVIPVKIASDAFYDAITVRMFASGNDYTIDDAGRIVGGSNATPRQWSEYWTLIRGRAAAAADARVCPNCGAPRAEGQTAICEYCGGKIISGEFPWILSRIEQDEAYRG